MTKVHTVPTGTIAAALGAVSSTQSAHTYYDPLDTLDTLLKDTPEFNERIASAICFGMDKRILRQAKTVVLEQWKAYKASELQQKLGFNDFCQQLDTMLSAPDLYMDDTPERTLAQLLGLHRTWHDRAFNLIGLEYNPETLRKQAFMESDDDNKDHNKNIPDVETREMYEIEADFWANGNAEERAAFIQDLMESDMATQASWEAADKRLAPTIMVAIQCASRHLAKEQRFDLLNEKTQAAICKSVVASIKKGASKAKFRMKGQPIAYARLNAQARKVVTEVEGVLAKKFSDAGELENCAIQHDIDKARAAKREALYDYA